MRRVVYLIVPAVVLYVVASIGAPDATQDSSSIADLPRADFTPVAVGSTRVTEGSNRWTKT